MNYLTPEGSGPEVVIASPERIIDKHGLHLEFSITNNEAKYEALIAGFVLLKN